MDFSPTVIEDDSSYIFTPELGDQTLTAKSIPEIESIIRRYPPIQSQANVVYESFKLRLTSRSTTNLRRISVTKIFFSLNRLGKSISLIITFSQITVFSVLGKYHPHRIPWLHELWRMLSSQR